MATARNADRNAGVQQTHCEAATADVLFRYEDLCRVDETRSYASR